MAARANLLDAFARDGLNVSFPTTMLEEAQPLRITFTEHGAAHSATLGGELPRSVTQSVPTLELADGTSPDASYTVLCSDFDLLKRDDQISGDVRHWLRSGARFDNDGKIEGGHDVSKYIGPAPGLGTGQHRYVFIIARETRPSIEATRYSATIDEDLKTRMKWNTHAFLHDEVRRSTGDLGSEAGQGLKIVGIGWMHVGADLASTVENIKLSAECAAQAQAATEIHRSVGKKLVGK